MSVKKIKDLNVLRQVGGSDYLFWFWCPGCDRQHWFKITTPEPHWDYNRDRARPSVEGEILVTNYPEMTRCRVRVVDGSAVFGDDCFHILAGSTVPLPTISAVQQSRKALGT